MPAWFNRLVGRRQIGGRAAFHTRNERSPLNVDATESYEEWVVPSQSQKDASQGPYYDPLYKKAFKIEYGFDFAKSQDRCPYPRKYRFFSHRAPFMGFQFSPPGPGKRRMHRSVQW
jgi:hypothetical protein